MAAAALATALTVLPVATSPARAQTAPGTTAARAALAGTAVPGAAVPGPPITAPPIPTSAAILVDVDTGRVLYEHDDRVPLPPASLTKTLVAMIAADWLPADAEIPVDTVAFNAYPDKVGMKPGQRWPLAIVMHALITDSANDAAYALGEDIGRSLAGFAPIMADAAKQIGMSDHPVLEDPAGLDGSEGFRGGNLISAWDLAVAGRDLMAIPELAAIAGEHTYDFEGPDHIAYHIVSRNLHFLLSYPGAVGVKTGFTDRAGYCSMEEAVRGGRHMLAVVLHSANPDAVAAALITAGFAEPAAAEPADAPMLPPVARPVPDRPAPDRVGHLIPTVIGTVGTAGGRSRPVAVASEGAGARQHGGPGDLVYGVAVVAAVGLVAVGARRNRRVNRRRRPGGGRSRR